MLEHKNHVMVALLPIGWEDDGHMDFRHLTLVYAGRQEDHSMISLDTLAKTALTIATMNSPITLPVLTKDVFGEGTVDQPKVDVIRFHTTLGLIRMREAVQDWNASKHPFNPHMTVGPEGSYQSPLPRSVTFNSVAFCNGNHKQEFRMTWGS